MTAPDDLSGDLRRATIELSPASRRGFVRACAINRDAAAKAGQTRLAEFWSALLCFVAEIEDRDKAGWASALASFDLPASEPGG